MPNSTIQNISAVINSANVRYDRLEGRDFVVCPMVMITEGVHNGSAGPLYYPGEELEKNVGRWNSKPIVVYHPTMNGKGISACDPDVFNSQKIGVILNTHYSGGKLKAEAWIELERVALIDNRVLDAIENNIPMELSTGLSAESENTPGEFNGETYDVITRNYSPDHLAILPDQIGACSLKDGAGFLIANSLAHSDIRTGLHDELRTRFGFEFFIEEVFPQSVIFDMMGKLHKLKYTKSNDVVKLDTGNPTLVRRNVQYRNVDGSLIGNADYTKPVSNFKNGVEDMTKEEQVNAIIANSVTQWTEDDREALMGTHTDFLAKMQIENKKEDEVETPAAPSEEIEAPAKIENAETVPAPQAVLSAKDQAVLNWAHSELAQRREASIEKIVANKQNPFSAAQLAEMSFEQLEGMAKLSEVAPIANAEPVPAQAQALFHGAQGSNIVNSNVNPEAGKADVQNATGEEALVMPSWNDAK